MGIPVFWLGLLLPACIVAAPVEGEAYVALQAIDGPPGPVGFFRTSDVVIAGALTNVSIASITVADIDKDLEWEYFFNAQEGSNLLLKMTDGQLYDIAQAYGVQQADVVGRTGTLAVACDIRGNGRDEIYAAAVGEEGKPLDSVLAYDVDLLQLRPRKMFMHGGRPTASVACVDASGAGTYDVYLGQHDGGLHVWDLRHRHSATLIKALEAEDDDEPTGQTISTLLAAPLTEHSPPIAPDVADIYAGDSQGMDHLLTFAGLKGGVHLGSAEANAGERPLAEYQHIAMRGASSKPTRTLGVLDANDDGLLDVVVGNEYNSTDPTSGSIQLLMNMGGGLFELSGSEAFKAVRGRVRAVLVADFDNDGQEEVLLMMKYSSQDDKVQPNILLRRDRRTNRTAAWEQIEAGDMTDDHGRAGSAAIADVDGDGRLDVVMVKGAVGAAKPVVLTGSDGRYNHYLRVMPLTRAGGPARGAVVRLVDMEGRKQMRVLDTGGMSAGQSEPVAHFGLGVDGEAFSVSITWPDGRSTTLLSPGLDRTMKVPYPYADINPATPYAGNDPGDTPAAGGDDDFVEGKPSPSPAPLSVVDDDDSGTCGEATCLTVEISPCPDANCTNAAGLCAEGSFFDRVPGATDDLPDRCFCRTGYEINPCPEGPGNNGMCSTGFDFYRAIGVDGSESCYCMKGDGSKKKANTTGGISAAALEAFRNCLAANPAGIVRCVAVMEALGYSMDDWGSWMPPTPTPTPGPEDLTAESYTIDPCPAEGSIGALSACRDGYLLTRKMLRSGEEECTCDLEKTSAKYAVKPCPAEGEEYECQPSYHFERDGDHCFCSKNRFDIDPCPAEGLGENMCSAGFRFAREVIGDVEKCACIKDRFQVIPCPKGNGTGVCPAPLVMVREVDPYTRGPGCFCVTPDDEGGGGMWHGGCEHCAYGNGACAYSAEKGWFCLCEEGDEGPDCIKSSWRPRPSLDRNGNANAAHIFRRRSEAA